MGLSLETNDVALLEITTFLLTLSFHHPSSCLKGEADLAR